MLDVTHLEIHCIGVQVAEEASGLAVDGHQVIGQQHQDGLGVRLVAAVRATTKYFC